MNFGILSRTDYSFGGWSRSSPHNLARCHSELLREAREAEEGGFFSFGVSEHHRTAGGYWSSPMLTSAFVGMATRKIKVGPIALLLPLYDPIRLAEDSSYLNIVLNGRLRICFAAGYNPADLSLFEVNRGHLKNLFASTLRTVYRCWSESSSRSDRSDRLLSVTPKPATPIPILIGTWSHGGLKRALGSSGGWVCSTFVPMGHVERLLAYFRRHSKGENKKPYAACIRETWVDTNRKRALSVA